MRKLPILAGIGIAGIIAGTATPAFADAPPSTPHQPVHVTTQVQTQISLSGITSALDFGQILPGTPKTLTGAESPTVVTNDLHGASILVNGENGGFKTAVGQPDVIPDAAISVTSPGHSPVQLANAGTAVDVADVGTGTHTVVQDWTLLADANTPAGDPLFADFSYSALAG